MRGIEDRYKVHRLPLLGKLRPALHIRLDAKAESRKVRGIHEIDQGLPRRGLDIAAQQATLAEHRRRRALVWRATQVARAKSVDQKHALVDDGFATLGSIAVAVTREHQERVVVED